MENTLNNSQIAELAKKNGYEYAALKAVIEVESSGHGFSQVTGRIIIQFEPTWFRRECGDWKNHIIGHTWQNNGVGDQTVEWKAFSDAYSIDANAAMEATSIGMMQVMGFHYKELGFDTVGHMWDYGKASEANQVDIGIKFIKSISSLDSALKIKNWPVFAFHYNGSEYQKFNYDNRLRSAYKNVTT